MPSQGVGGNGTASEFGDLTGMTRQEFLQGLGASKTISKGGYVEYKFPDASKVTIRLDGEIVRTPAPTYSSDGRRINKGLCLDRNGDLLQTRDQFGNLIPETHNTGEKVSD